MSFGVHNSFCKIKYLCRFFFIFTIMCKRNNDKITKRALTISCLPFLTRKFSQETFTYLSKENKIKLLDAEACAICLTCLLPDVLFKEYSPWWVSPDENLVDVIIFLSSCTVFSAWRTILAPLVEILARKYNLASLPVYASLKWNLV